MYDVPLNLISKKVTENFLANTAKNGTFDF